MYSEKDIVALIDRMTPDQLIRPLNRLWQRQTEDERAMRSTVYHNKVGFSAADVGFAGSVKEWWESKGFLTAKQTLALRKMLKKYRKQLVQIANEPK